MKVQDQVWTDGGYGRALSHKPSVYIPVMQTTACMAGLRGLCGTVLRAPHIFRAFHNLQNLFPDVISLHGHSHSVGLVWLFLFCKWKNQPSAWLSKSHAVQGRESWMWIFSSKRWAHPTPVPVKKDGSVSWHGNASLGSGFPVLHYVPFCLELSCCVLLCK